MLLDAVRSACCSRDESFDPRPGRGCWRSWEPRAGLLALCSSPGRSRSAHLKLCCS